MTNSINSSRAMQLQVLRDIAEERAQQDAKHGGPSHDDTHSDFEWDWIINRHLERVIAATTTGKRRQQLVRVAALAIAAIESYDRRLSPSSAP